MKNKTKSTNGKRISEGELEANWALGDYVSVPCPNCSRLRLCKCDNGKHRCEKCNWVPEDDFYCPVNL